MMGLLGCSPKDRGSQSGGTDASSVGVDGAIHHDARDVDAVGITADSSVAVSDASTSTNDNSVVIDGQPVNLGYGVQVTKPFAAIIYQGSSADLASTVVLSTFPLNPGTYTCDAFGVAMQLNKGAVSNFFNSSVAGSTCSIHVTQVDLDGGPYVGTYTATLKATNGTQAVLTNGHFSGTYVP
jgi:hypothetical protein